MYKCFLCGPTNISHSLESTRWLQNAYSRSNIASAPTLNVGASHPQLLEAKKYLVRFGFSRPDALKWDGVLDSETSIALLRFQTAHSLRPTGVFDSSTRKLMSSQRCAMTDWDDPLGALSIGPWKKKALTYCFANLSQQQSPDSLKSAVTRAFITWASVPQIGLSFAEGKNEEQCDILIKWVPANDPDRSLVGPLVAHADYPPGYSLISSTTPIPLHFDDQETVWTSGGTGMDMESLALHEIGHCLGLIHGSDPECVMYATVQEGKVKAQLHSSDLAAIKALYI